MPNEKEVSMFEERGRNVAEGEVSISRKTERNIAGKVFFSIRKIRENDIDEVAALERCIFSDAWTKRGIEESLRQEYTVLLGVWKDEYLAGYVIMYYVLDEGEIARIAASPDCRRQGAASLLLGHLEKICESEGILRLMLEVRRSNAAAVSFYKKHGFTEYGVRRGYYTAPSEDAILMSKKL